MTGVNIVCIIEIETETLLRVPRRRYFPKRVIALSVRSSYPIHYARRTSKLQRR